MNEFFSNLYQEASNRFKSPIIGTFVLCWLAYNYVWVAELVLAKDNAARLIHIKTSSISLESGITMPLIMVLAYTFLIPLVQWLLDTLKFNLIDHPRLKTHHGNEAKKYRSQATVSRWKNIASDEYWQELHKNHAENAGKQVITIKERISFLYADISQGENNLRIAENNYNLLDKNNKKINLELQESKNKALQLGSEVEELLNQLKRISIHMHRNLKTIQDLECLGDAEYKDKDEKLLALIAGDEDINVDRLFNESYLSDTISNHLSENRLERNNMQQVLSQVAISLVDMVNEIPVAPLEGVGISTSGHGA